MRISDLFRKVGVEPLSRENALAVMKALAEEHDLPYIIFESREAADQFMKDLRCAVAVRKRAEIYGLELPEEPLN